MILIISAGMHEGENSSTLLDAAVNRLWLLHNTTDHPLTSENMTECPQKTSLGQCFVKIWNDIEQ